MASKGSGTAHHEDAQRGTEGAGWSVRENIREDSSQGSGAAHHTDASTQSRGHKLEVRVEDIRVAWAFTERHPYMASKGSGAVHLLDAQRGAEGTCWSSGQEGQTGSPGQRKAKMCWFSAGLFHWVPV